ncbi:MAG: TadE/TadG family type IV pilus assembly protein [Gemmatirosa sp.]
MRRPTRLPPRLTHAARDAHGAAVVEFALVVPVLLLLVFAIIDFGRALWTMNVLTSGVREGARAASVQATRAAMDSAGAKHTADYINGVLGAGTVSAGAVRVLPDSTNPGDYGQILVELRDGYQFQAITPFAASMGLGNVKFRPKAYFRWELAS